MKGEIKVIDKYLPEISGVIITPDMIKKSVYNMGNTYPIAKVIRKAVKKGEVTLCAFGGSITEGTGMKDNPPAESGITYPEGGNMYTSINFQADIENPECCVYPMENFYEAKYIHQSFSELWRFGTLADKYKCLSIFYDLVSYISRIDHLERANKRKFYLIEPAVEYMKKHIYDRDFKIDKLHALCGISDTYFRKIFISRYNMTPKQYLVTERILYAKSIIESGDYGSIKEVSEMVGYNDPLYFSKAFKMICGVSPSNAIF